MTSGDLTTDCDDAMGDEEESSRLGQILADIQKIEKNTSFLYQCSGLGLYSVFQGVIEDSDHSLVDWMNRQPVHHVSIQESKVDLPNGMIL